MLLPIHLPPPAAAMSTCAVLPTSPPNSQVAEKERNPTGKDLISELVTKQVGAARGKQQGNMHGTCGVRTAGARGRYGTGAGSRIPIAIRVVLHYEAGRLVAVRVRYVLPHSLPCRLHCD